MYRNRRIGRPGLICRQVGLNFEDTQAAEVGGIYPQTINSISGVIACIWQQQTESTYVSKELPHVRNATRVLSVEEKWKKASGALLYP